MSSADDREHIPPLFVLVSYAKVPEDGSEDLRYILRGRQGAPAVRVWPRLMTRRKWHELTLHRLNFREIDNSFFSPAPLAIRRRRAVD